MALRKSDSNSSMYSGTPCDKCGGPTLGFPSGSIWCPDEDAHPGGHFVVRVAFERAPNREPSSKREWSTQPPKRTAVSERRSSPPTSKPVKVAKATDGFDAGFDGFVKGGD
jgi:hypothetical protein